MKALYNDNYHPKFEDLKGKVITKFENLKEGEETVKIYCDDGSIYQMKYYHDCCAECSVEDIAGDVNDIIGSPILLAEEVESNENPPDVKKEIIGYQDSFTWTFYKLSTIKGSVTIRWYGESNGYYSESVTFEKLQMY